MMLQKFQMNAFQVTFILVLLVFVFGCDLHLRGQKESGFEVELNTRTMRSDDIYKLESILIDKGFIMVWKERPIPDQNKPNSVITEMNLPKEYRGELYSISFALFFEKDNSQKQAHNLRIVIGNWQNGGVIPELTGEINNISNKVYNYLIGLYGKENVTMQFRGNIINTLRQGW